MTLSKVKESFSEHPFLNPLIVTNVFSWRKWGYQELRAMRLVCKLWHQLTLEDWRSIATIIITDAADGPHIHSHGISLKTFSNHCAEFTPIYKFLEKPFSKYTFCRWNASIGRIESQFFEHFWELVGPSVEVLRMDRCHYLEDCKGRGFVDILFTRLPNLKHLTVIHETNSVTYYKRRTLPYEETNGVELMRSYPEHPNLKSLEIVGVLPAFCGIRQILSKLPSLERFDYSRDFAAIENYAEILFPAVWRVEQSQIKHLKIFNCNHFDINHVRHLRLESLTFVALQNNLHNILDHHHATLKILKIINYANNQALQNQAERPMVLQLKEIYLTVGVGNTLEFLNRTPNLEILCVDSDWFEWWRETVHVSETPLSCIWKRNLFNIVEDSRQFLNNFRLENMNQLRIDHQLRRKSLFLLKRCMPCLTILQVILNNAGFRAVCTFWPFLQELTLLFGSIVDDDGIVGVVDEDCIPNIRNLEYLEKIVVQSHCNMGKLGDLSVYDGFLNLSRLHTVQMPRSENLTEEACESLKARIRNVVITDYHEVGKGGFECCERVRFERESLHPFPCEEGWNRDDDAEDERNEPRPRPI